MYVPKVYDEYTSKRVLVCEWVEGIQLTNVEALTEAGIDYKEAMKIAIDAFSSQIFRSGFVHGKILFFAHNLTKKKWSYDFIIIGDPHPGNVLVRKNPHKKKQVEVVLIDHGLYILESEK